MDTYGRRLGSMLASTLLGLPPHPVTLTQFSKMQPPAGDHVCSREAEKKKKKKEKSSAREGEKEQSQAGWSRLHLLRLWQSKLELF